VTLAGATVVAVALLAGMPLTTPARANGDATFSLHRFVFSRYADDEEPVASMLRVAWRDQRRHTGRIEAGGPAPD
jgi:hypothetical protein